jgi:hypothetical protein
MDDFPYISDDNHLVIQFSSSTALASGLIRMVLGCPFSHTDIVTPDGNMMGASDQGPHSPCIEGNPEGVAVRPSNYQEFSIRRRLVLKTDRAPAIIAAGRTQLGKPFDKSALKAMLNDKPFDRNWNHDLTHWFCSEWTVYAMVTGLFWPWDIPWGRNRFSPWGLWFTCVVDPRLMNRSTFWDPIPGLVLGRHET